MSAQQLLQEGAAQGLSRMASVVHGAAEQLASAARVTRFLQGRLQFQVRPDDIFISSYPRSGTTWIQQILVVLTRNGDQEGHISEFSPWFERRLALGFDHAEDFQRLRSPRVFKSHLPYQWLPKGARYIYVSRDGRDVAVSYYHLYRTHLGYQEGFDRFYERFCRGDVQYGSWFKHVSGWAHMRDAIGVKMVKYEDMQRDLPAVMMDLAAFCGLSLSRERISELAEFCSFGYMKRHQDRFDHATEERALRGMTTGNFVRRGKTGAFDEYFSQQQLERFEQQTRMTRPWSRLELRLSEFLR